MLNDTNSAMIKKSVGRISDSVIRQDHAIYWIYDEVYQQIVINSIFPYYKEDICTNRRHPLQLKPETWFTHYL